MVARGRIRGGADQHRDGDRATRRARRRQQAGRLADRNLEPAARAAARHERQFQLAGAAALPNAPPQKALNDIPDERGGGATRNGFAIYDLPRHRLIHHMLPDVPLRTSSLRGLGAWANVLCDRKLHRRAGRDRRRRPGDLPAVAALRSPPAQVVETAAQMSGWFDQAKLPRRPSPRLRLRALQEHRRLRAAVVAEVEVDEEVRLKRIWAPPTPAW